MNISSDHCTPNQGLGATKQATRESGASRKNFEVIQLTLWKSPQSAESLLSQKRQKRQILSVPGTSPQKRNRYRVIFQGQILGNKLSIDKAVALTKRGGR
jgi:hypothetical protein